MKKALALVLAATLVGTAFAGCKKKEDQPGETTKTIKVAALESGYGAQMWKDVAKAFEDANPGVKVELTIDKNIEDVIGTQMKAGNYPDVVHLAVGREDALTETLIKEKALMDLSEVLDMNIPGESVKVKDKIVPGFTDTLATNPYSDNKTYLAPMFYGPCGLFYNANLLKEKGWEVPKTWDEMWALGDKAKAEGIALFTYPTAGYFDAFMYALLTSAGGPEFFNKVMRYEEGIWDTKEAKDVLDIIGKLAKYTEKTTVANANKDNFHKNQQLVLDNKAIFMPNGTWITGEMKDAPRVNGFEWGFTAIPSVYKDGDPYSYTFFEQAWIPKEAKNKDLAKQFVAFLYSDKATEIFAKAGAIQPINDVSKMLEGENKLFYSIYDNGAKAAMGVFASTDPVEGVNIYDELFSPIDSIVSGNKTIADWKAGIIKASDALRKALK